MITRHYFTKRNCIAVLKPSFIILLSVLIFTGSLSAQSKRFTLLNTTDEHSTLLPVPMADYHPDMVNPAIGGYARLSTLVKAIREEKGDEPVLLFSSGDILGGTPFAWLSLEGYSPEIELMKMIGYNGMTIGNHEFDYGPDKLAGYFLRAGYPEYNETLPLIASNLVIPEGNRLHEIGLQDNHIFLLSNGLKLGVFGLLGKDAYSVASYAEPVTVEDQHTVAVRQIRMLRDAGADLVIALSHSGIGEDRDLALAVDGLDIILGGHDHYITHQPEIVNNTLILHTGYYLGYLGRLDLEWDPQTGGLTTVNHLNDAPFLLPLDSSVEEDRKILELTDQYLIRLNEFVSAHTEGVFNDVNTPLLRSEFEMKSPGPFVETTVGNFVTDAMRLMAGRYTGERVDLSVQGNGVIRADIIPGTMDWSRQLVSFFDMVTVSGLGMGPDGSAGYPLVSFYLTGDEIYNLLEITSLLSQLLGDNYFLQMSGLRYSYDPGKAIWLRIPFLGTPVPAYRSVIDASMYAGDGVQDDGNYEPIEPDRLYHVVTDYYLTSFLPMVGEILPRLTLVLKDRHGNPVELDETVIMHDGREYKVWEAVARYSVSFEKDDLGIPVMPGYYESTSDRIVSREGIPLKVWSYAILAAVLVLLILLVRLIVRSIRRRLKKRS